MGMQCEAASERLTVSGERLPGGFILIRGLDGIRYAVRHSSIAAIQDADPCHDETLIAMHGGAVVRVSASLDEVLAWFS